MKPLDGAYKRIDRASEHLDELKRGINIFLEHKTGSVSIDYQRLRSPIERNKFIYVRSVRSRPIPVPQRFSILVGEIIYNLRAALDYLVYELACFDSRQEIEGTQFPIEDSPEKFNNRICSTEANGKGKFLKGVSPEHIMAIRRLQPFNGCQWTRQLRDISNPDKHRRLAVVDSPIAVGSEVDRIEALLADQSVNVKDVSCFDVVFRDGTSVMETLEQFRFKAIETLDSLKPEFK
jgi:hypothetical protein